MPVLLRRPEDVILSEDDLSDDRLVTPAMPRDLHDDRPPLFRTWGQLYAAIVGYLFFLIGLFYAFTRAYQFPP